MKKNMIALLNVLWKIKCQVPTKRCLFKVTFVTFVKYQLQLIQQSFSRWVNVLLTLILQMLLLMSRIILMHDKWLLSINFERVYIGFLALSHVLAAAYLKLNFFTYILTSNSYFAENFFCITNLSLLCKWRLL